MSESNVAGIRPLSHVLRMAVVAGVESAVRLHIARGDDLNARDARGMTPLMLSAAANRPAICRLLLGAGADHGLVDASGRSALEIAIAAGAEDAAAILGSFQRPAATFPESGAALLHLGPDRVIEALRIDDPIVIHATSKASSGDGGPSEPATRVASPEPEASTLPAPSIGIADGSEFDLSAWEAEEEAAPPKADIVVLTSASGIQVAIASHKPIDTSADWDDIDACLPELALPLARTDDAESRTLLRRLLLRAIREGSVPGINVQALSTNEDRSANPEAEAYLAKVVNDLGAEVDERFEYSNANESFEVFVDPSETQEEEAALDEALSAIDRAASPRHEPLRIYQREFQRLQLLTAEEEIELAQAMEAALDAALVALAGWPVGIARTLSAGMDVMAGLRPLSSMCIAVAQTDPELASVHDADFDAPPIEAANRDMEEDEEQADDATADAGFADALRRLSALAERTDVVQQPTAEIREALSAIRLNRHFLLKLDDAADGPAPSPTFRCAIDGFRKARDRMAAANLKLAFFHAKKYLYSGEPLDDLAQEGNIGLLKAVDRYEWRRGFRFSTYATWWIRQQISRYVADKARTIRVPVHVYEKLQRMQHLAGTIETTFGREATLDELAAQMEMPSRKVAALLSIAPEPCSIDELPVDEMVAIEAREAYTFPDPADIVDERQLRLAVEHLISSLSERDSKEERVLRLRFGIRVDDALTLEEVGQRFSVTRERIRQIEAGALKKLRHPARSEPFARRALGIKRKPPPCDASDPTDGIAEPPDTFQAMPKAAAANRPAIAHPSHDVVQPPSSAKGSGLDRLLALAAKLEVPVEDGRSRESGRIWVRLLATPDSTRRRLVRKLLEFGFEHSPGKGYWR
ncbi:MAG TPA: sigma-70 family RNA polymerase sigma factor [Methylibium sp.]|uniref:sigma-70 family RNA polymerase sigma factor n=1 Tax=Methylibium sp. TaxID=2067992 RepID=UPI002DB8E352|nr:sigma-70 family RNA polymerase sigma factor [Methylibium sp.]HEU4460853.1 sigma-70 family RNA polymerase sigma factor [Methylibium sp.]